jgi:hypothetical protein
MCVGRPGQPDGGSEMRSKDGHSDAQYIPSMCGSLGKMAREQGYEFGAYLLEMAFLEFTRQQQELAEQTALSGKPS